TADPDVLYEFYKLWEAAGYGSAPTERAAWVIKKSGDKHCVKRWPWSATPGKETWKGKIPDNTEALAHTHPDKSCPQHSANDRDAADKFWFPVYAVTRQGIYKYDPKTKKTTQEEKGDWWSKGKMDKEGCPCP